ncbi:MAG: RHS repeat-associated core domain-containing protein [Planctomycetota bacterium]
MFDTFGRLTSETNSAVDSHFAFTGKFFDDLGDTELSTSLSHHWNRWYDPQLGKWLSEDPIGFAGGDVNLGRYVGNHATGAVDWSGLFDDPWWRDSGWDFLQPWSWGGCLSEGLGVVAVADGIGFSSIHWQGLQLDREFREVRQRILGERAGRGDFTREFAQSYQAGSSETAAIRELATQAVLHNASGGFYATPLGSGGRATALSGRSAEDAVANATGIPVNRGLGRQVVPGTGLGGFRIPDMAVFGPGASLEVRGTIIEVKNVTTLSGTRQIRDLADAAKDLGGHLEIFTNARIPKSGVLRDLIDQGRIVVQPLPAN